MINSRRLLVVALLVIAPAIAACGSITAHDDPTSPDSPADSTAFGETKTWG